MKQTIVAVSFGTTYEEAERAGIAPVERALAEAFPDWDVCRAWTARMIARKLRARGVEVENEVEAIARLRAASCPKIALASTHIIPGTEYGMLREAADGLPVSAPLINDAEDVRWMAELLKGIAGEEGRTLLVMGHGTDHAANAIYEDLRAALPENVKLACVEGELTIDGIWDELEAIPGKAVTLMPLMLVAGDHARNDLAGDDEDSWKSQLARWGFDVRVRLEGLGAHPEVQQRFVQKVRAIL